MWRTSSIVGVLLAGQCLLGGACWWITVERQETLVYEQHARRLLEVGRTARAAMQAALVAEDVRELAEKVAELSRQTGLRLTCIAADGRVLADSGDDPHGMENHLDRPEIQAAAGPAQEGVARRRSATTGKKMQYVAVPILAGERPSGFVRVASETRLVDEPLALNRVLFLVALVSTLGLTVVGLWRLAVLEIGPFDRRGRRGSGEQDDASTDLRLASRPIAATSDSMSNVLANMAEGVLAVDAEQRVILANEASRNLLDFVGDNVEGRPLWEVLRNRIVEEAVAETLHAGKTTVREWESSTLPRRVLTLRSARLAGEPTPGVVMVLHDVTELRRLENMRREFVANVSHELKTPLASIKAYAETLRLGAVNDPEHNVEFVRRIEEESDRLHELILDLLHLARVETGQEAFEITSVLIEPLVNGCLKSFASTAAAKNIELRAEPAAAPVWVRADEEGLRTILSNLIDNGLKYTPAGGRVTVRWGVQGGEGWFEVQDTGIGIGKQHHARIFERFYRVDKARSRELGGTGLGLSIVKHLTQAFGGNVRLESQLRAGSVFRVTLPLADPRAAGDGD